MNFLPNVLQKFVTAAYFKGLAWYNLGPRVYHSHPQVVSINPRMKVHVVPALSDNYMYILEDPETKTAAVIDPVEPDKIIEIVQNAELNLTAVLTTHHHWDHAGGNEVIAKKMPNLHIYGGDNRIGALTHHVKHNDTFDLGNLKIRCLFTPCHTSGHICYFVESENEDPIVFTGDTLFTAGCGRFFEGTADQMFEALVNILGSLPDITKVFCGHEYLLQNLAFAAHVEPENEDIKAKIAWAKAKREKSEPTVPSTIGEEKRINPFMRVMEPTVQKYARQGDAVAAMRVIRKEKDTFKAQI